MALSVRNHVAFPVNLTIPSPEGYLVGGYTHRFDLTVPGSAVAEDCPPLTALLDVTDDGLRSVGNGGFVVSEDGLDIALATTIPVGGVIQVTRLAFDLRHYDPASGRVVGWVLLPGIRVDADTPLYLYVGAPDPVVIDPEAAWSPWEGMLAGDRQDPLAIDATPLKRHARGVQASSDGPVPFHDAFECSNDGLQGPDITARRRFFLSFWLKQPLQAGSGWANVYAHNGPTMIAMGVDLRRGGDGGDRIRASMITPTGSGTFECDAAIDDDEWHHVQLTWDDVAGGALYLDGSLLPISAGDPSFLNVDCEPGASVTWGSEYVGALWGMRHGWVRMSAAQVLADHEAVTGNLLAIQGDVEEVPTIVETVVETIPLTYQFADDATGADIDRNVYLFPRSGDFGWMSNPPDCAVGNVLTGDCWFDASGFDLLSRWIPDSANVSKYQDPVTYGQSLAITGSVAMRVWSCIDGSPSSPGDGCDPDDVQLIQYLGCSNGDQGYFSERVFADFIVADWRALAGADGLPSVSPVAPPTTTTSTTTTSTTAPPTTTTTAPPTTTTTSTTAPPTTTTTTTTTAPPTTTTTSTPTTTTTAPPTTYFCVTVYRAWWDCDTDQWFKTLLATNCHASIDPEPLNEWFTNEEDPCYYYYYATTMAECDGPGDPECFTVADPGTLPFDGAEPPECCTPISACDGLNPSDCASGPTSANNIGPSVTQLATSLSSSSQSAGIGFLSHFVIRNVLEQCLTANLFLTADEWANISSLTAPERTITAVVRTYDCDGVTLLWTSDPLTWEATGAGNNAFAGNFDLTGAPTSTHTVLSITCDIAMASQFIGTTQRFCYRFYESISGDISLCQSCGLPYVGGYGCSADSLPFGLPSTPMNNFVYVDDGGGLCHVEWSDDNDFVVLRCDIDTGTDTFLWTLTVSDGMSTCTFESSSPLESPQLVFEGYWSHPFGVTFDVCTSGGCAETPTIGS